MKTRAIILTLAALIFMVSSIFAQDKEKERQKTVTVSGNAEIRVAPDIVTITLGIESQNPKLEDAKSDNDKRAEAVLALAKELDIEQKYFSTDYISVSPVYKQRRYDELELPTLVGYRVQRTVEVILKEGNVAKFEKLVSRAIEVGANYIFNIEFKTTKLREYRDKARKMAIKAAKEKAELLAGELGQKVGKAISISEGYGGWYAPYNRGGFGNMGGGYSGYMSQQQNISQEARSGSSTEDSETATTFSVGQISVNASVNVTFEIVD